MSTASIPWWSDVLYQRDSQNRLGLQVMQCLPLTVSSIFVDDGRNKQRINEWGVRGTATFVLSWDIRRAVVARCCRETRVVDLYKQVKEIFTVMVWSVCASQRGLPTHSTRIAEHFTGGMHPPKPTEGLYPLVRKLTATVPPAL